MKLAAVSAATMSLGLPFGCNGSDDDPLEFAVFSDAHLYDPSLGTTGQAFETYLYTQAKLLRESPSIVQSVVDSIAASDARFVLVPGDMTKDGELVCHELMASYLAQLKAAGKQAYVVPGNHDVLNPVAYSYSGSTTTPVPSVTPVEFAAIYADYGYDAAIARDPNSLSYVAEPADGYWLLAMDSCIYNSTSSTAYTAGAFSSTTMSWLLARLAEAEQRGKTVIGLVHHALTEHFTGQATLFPGFVINDWANVSRSLAQAGLRYVFSGHFHATDITDRSWTGPDALLHDIETGSLANYPCPYRTVSIDNETMSIDTTLVTSVAYNTGGLTFQQYAQNNTQTGLLHLFEYILAAAPFNLSTADAAANAPLFATAMMAHYVGDEAPDASSLATIQAFLASADPTDNAIGQFLSTLWTDLAPSDNSLVITMA